MEKVNYEVKGKVAVITGGAQGLGYAMADALSWAGADVVIADLQVEKAQQAVRELSKVHNNRAIAVQLDVAQKASVEAASEAIVKHFGRIDILVNNAGVLLQKAIEETEEEDWDFLMGINLKGVFLCSKIFGRSMMANRSGKIINISSVVAFLGAEKRILYGTSKSGVAHMTKLFATEWAKYNITVNAIAPGYLLTDMTAANFNDPERGKEFLRMVPLKRFGEPQDIAGTVVFLASRASDYITGQVIIVDGGRVLL